MSYPRIDPLSTPPNRSMAPAVFESTADTFLSGLPNFGSQQNALGSWMNGTAATVESNSLLASNAAASAAANANFKGAWSSLRGSLNIPASVYHNSKIWMLLNNLANVTTSEPGVSADWFVIATTSVVRFNVIDSSTNITLSPREFVRLTASGRTVTLPLNPSVGDEVGISWGNWINTTVNGNGKNIVDASGVGRSTFTLDVANRSIILIYTINGWVLI